MDNKNLKKINYGARNVVLTVIVGILLVFDLIALLMGISELKSNHGPKIEYLQQQLKNGQYASVLNSYDTYYNPNENYDKEFEEFYAAAEYYEHASIYVAAEACGNSNIASKEKAKMEEAYGRMGDNQKYAEAMLESLK